MTQEELDRFTTGIKMCEELSELIYDTQEVLGASLEMENLEKYIDEKQIATFYATVAEMDKWLDKLGALQNILDRWQDEVADEYFIEDGGAKNEKFY